jgi:hypothetical protein
MQTACLFFVAGTAVQCLANFYNLKMNTFVFNLDLIYNNQNATLLAMALFYSLAYLFSTSKLSTNILALAVNCLLGGSLVLSMSRTAWLGFLVALPVFFYLLLRFGKAAGWWKKMLAVTVVLVVTGSLLAVYFSIDADPNWDGVQNAVLARLGHFYQILDPAYWQYTVADAQNFGFFGISRLQQLYFLNDLMQDHLLFGIGFAKTLTDFHGFYFTLLGAAGLVGIAFFLLFVWNLLRGLERIFCKTEDRERALLAAAAFCAVLVWLVSSVTQSMFIHFSVWIQPVIVMTLMSQSLHEVKGR